VTVDLNLLPEAMKKALLRERKVRFALWGLSLATVVILLTYCLVTFAAWQTWGEAAGLRREQSGLINEINSLLPYASLQADIAQKEALLKKALGGVPDWPALLGSLGESAPADLWLSGLTFTAEQSQLNPDAASEQDSSAVLSAEDRPLGKLIIAGYAEEYVTVADWLSQIRQIPGLAEVNCIFAAKEETNGIAVIHFEIEALVVEI